MNEGMMALKRGSWVIGRRKRGDGDVGRGLMGIGVFRGQSRGEGAAGTWWQPSHQRCGHLH